MRLACQLDELRTAVRALGDVWRDSHADAEGAVALSASAGDTQLVVRAANRTTYGQVHVALAEAMQADVSVTLSGAVLTTLLRKMNDEQVLIESEGGRLTLRQGERRSYELNGLAGEVATRPDDVPVCDRLLDMDQTRRMGDLLVLCTSMGDMRTALGGVQLQWADGMLHMLASDSVRFAHAHLPTLDAATDGEVIIPVRAFEWLMRTAKLLHASAAHIGSNERWLAVRVGPTEICVPPQAGRFPPWRQIMPQSAAPGMVVQREELLGCVQRLAPFAGHADVVVWTRRGRSLELATRNGTLGSASELIDPSEGVAQLDDHASYTVALLAGALGKWPHETVNLAWPRGDTGPLLVRAEGIEYLQMPLHTGLEN